MSGATAVVMFTVIVVMLSMIIYVLVEIRDEVKKLGKGD